MESINYLKYFLLSFRVFFLFMALNNRYWPFFLGKCCETTVAKMQPQLVIWLIPQSCTLSGFFFLFFSFSEPHDSFTGGNLSFSVFAVRLSADLKNVSPRTWGWPRLNRPQRVCCPNVCCQVNAKLFLVARIELYLFRVHFICIHVSCRCSTAAW